MKTFLACAAMALAGIATASAAPMTLQLTAGNMLAQTHSHAMIMNVTGTYRQLSGTLDFDLAAKTCKIDVTFEVKSLELPNALIRSQTMGKDFLDPDDYPENHFAGTCQGDQLTGNLTVHGQTHPFTMQISFETSGGQVTGIHAEGVMNRYDWGIVGHDMTVGQNIRVTNDISLNGQPPQPPAS